jgi:hypothetical protein
MRALHYLKRSIMKKFMLFIFFSIVSVQLNYAQTKNYLSIEYGPTFSGMSDKLSKNMKDNHFGARIDYDVFFFFFFFSGSTQFPKHDTRNENYKIRYGHNLKERVSVEAGFGHTYNTIVRGASVSGQDVNYLNISSDMSTAYAAYLWKNKKDNAAIGIGPAVSICKITQEDPTSGTVLSKKNYLLPGVIVTGYWNIINKKIWFMGLRSDMSITAPARTETVTITNPHDTHFVSVSKGTTIGAVTNTFSLSAGIKF